MKSELIVLLLCVCFSVIHCAYIINADEEEKEIGGNALGSFDLAALIKKYGYPFESKLVTTPDNYTLTLHRIPYNRDPESNTGNRPPVLIMHGFLGCSADFFHIGIGKSLPLRLADEGYDVWIGNNRGNSYSRSHKNMVPSNPLFWDFSFDDIGTKDTPVIIDYILTETKFDNLSYVGHSSGATQLFILTSLNTEYNKKINGMVALAPLVYVANATSPLLYLINDNDYAAILGIEAKLNVNEFLQHNLILDLGLQTICKNGSKTEKLCKLLMFLVEGFDASQLEDELLPQFLLSFPAGTSIKEVNHFLQNRISGEFRQFDYGKIKNWKIYKSLTPPSYNLSKVTVPVSIYYGQNDLIVNKRDIDRLVKELPKAEAHPISYAQFNHWDFFLAKDVDSFVNFDIINTLNAYNNLSLITTTTSKSSTTTSGTTTTPSGTTTTPSGTTTTPSGTTTTPSGTTPSGTTTTSSGTTPSGTTTTPSGTTTKPSGTTTISPFNILLMIGFVSSKLMFV